MTDNLRTGFNHLAEVGINFLKWLTFSLSLFLGNTVDLSGCNLKVVGVHKGMVFIQNLVILIELYKRHRKYTTLVPVGHILGSRLGTRNRKSGGLGIKGKVGRHLGSGSRGWDAS